MCLLQWRPPFLFLQFLCLVNSFEVPAQYTHCCCVCSLQVEGEGVGVNTATPSRPSPCGRAGGSGGRGGGHHSTRLGWDGRVLRLSRPNKAEGGSTGVRAVEWSPPFSLTSSSPPFSLPSQQHPSRTIVESRPPKIHPSPPLPPSQQTASWRSAWLW
ncbi:unnamed protein product [Closterium sp. NIES-65]|nr:unnamed protein product [Closterium sp. NIES-65]